MSNSPKAAYRKRLIGERLDFIGDAYISMFVRKYVQETYPFLPARFGFPLCDFLTSNLFLKHIGDRMHIKYAEEISGTGKARASSFEYLIGGAANESVSKAYLLFRGILDDFFAKDSAFIFNKSLKNLFDETGRRGYSPL